MEHVPIEALKEGAWREIARIDLALEGKYLAAAPWGRSGKGGDEAGWIDA